MKISFESHQTASGESLFYTLSTPPSHFEVYLRAMNEAGANMQPITRFLADLAAGLPLEDSLLRAEAPVAACAFVRTTFALIGTGQPAIICAAFTLGREHAIPDVFGALLTALPGGAAEVPTLDRYLRRHIELDGEDHGPKSLEMLATICGDDQAQWSDATAAAACALEARIALWTGISKAFAGAAAYGPRAQGVPIAASQHFHVEAYAAAAAMGRRGTGLDA